MKAEVLLKAAHVFKSFGATKAVVDFGMEINRGEIHGLIGENGSGKSTFSSILSGILKPDQGELWLRGEPYSPSSSVDASNHGVALVVQEIGTIGTITAAANIFLNREELFIKNGAINFRKMHTVAREILSEIGGAHIHPETVTQALNLEDRKLIEIAKAMYSKPELLIIDETSNALAKGGRDVLYKNIRAVRDNGGAVLFITHDLNELCELCDCVTIMRDGRYVATLQKDEMIKVKQLKELMVGREVGENLYREDLAPSWNDEIVLDAKMLNAINVDNISFQLHQGEILGIRYFNL